MFHQYSDLLRCMCGGVGPDSASNDTNVAALGTWRHQSKLSAASAVSFSEPSPSLQRRGEGGHKDGAAGVTLSDRPTASLNESIGVGRCNCRNSTIIQT